MNTVVCHHPAEPPELRAAGQSHLRHLQHLCHQEPSSPTEKQSCVITLQSRQRYLQLKIVTYGASSAFAISFWVKLTHKPCVHLQSRQSYVQLENVTYGASGAFAISFWIKPTDLAGAFMGYLYSHNASSPGDQTISPNQVPAVIA